MGDNAYRLGRKMVWSSTAELYMRSFDLAGLARPYWAAAPRKIGRRRESSAMRPHESPELNLGHLYHMTDSTGIFQHARLTEPNLSEGYCTDDNGRALIAAALLGQLEEAPKRVRALAKPTPPSWTTPSIQKRAASTIS